MTSVKGCEKARRRRGQKAELRKEKASEGWKESRHGQERTGKKKRTAALWKEEVGHEPKGKSIPDKRPVEVGDSGSTEKGRDKAMEWVLH